MKREYTKPDILFESFSLSTNIAGDCEKKTGTPSQGNCPAYLPGVTVAVFNDSIRGCIAKPPKTDSDEYNGVCYHVPNVDNNLLNS